MNNMINITFKCVDRLNETKHLECLLNKTDNDSKNIYNQNLIANLNEFQVAINQAMTQFVENEKKAVFERILVNNFSNIEMSESEESSEDEEVNKMTDEPQEKKQCLEN